MVVRDPGCYEDPDWIEVEATDPRGRVFAAEVYSQTRLWAVRLFESWLELPAETEMIRKVRMIDAGVVGSPPEA